MNPQWSIWNPKTCHFSQIFCLLNLLIFLLEWISCSSFPSSSALIDISTCGMNQIALYGGTNPQGICDALCPKNPNYLNRFCIFYPEEKPCEASNIGGKCQDMTLLLGKCKQYSCSYNNFNQSLEILTTPSTDDDSNSGSDSNIGSDSDSTEGSISVVNRNQEHFPISSWKMEGEIPLNIGYLGELSLENSMKSFLLNGNHNDSTILHPLWIHSSALNSTFLTKVEFHTVKIQLIPSNCLPNSIKELKIINCDLTFDILKQLNETKYSQLNTINLSSNAMEQIPFFLLNLKNLKVLDLSENSRMSLTMNRSEYKRISLWLKHPQTQLILDSSIIPSSCSQEQILKPLRNDQNQEIANVCVYQPSFQISPTPDPSNSSNSNFYHWLIIALSIAGSLLLLSFVSIYVHRRRQYRHALSSLIISPTNSIELSSEYELEEPRDHLLTNSNNSENEKLNYHTLLHGLRITNEEITSIKPLPNSFDSIHSHWSCGMYQNQQVILQEVVYDLNTTTETLKQIQESIQLLSHLSHPNILEFHGVKWYTNAIPLSLVMEYVDDGQTLRSFLNWTKMNQGHLIWSTILDLGFQLIHVLDYIHSFNDEMLIENFQSHSIFFTSNGQCKLSMYSSCFHVHTKFQYSLWKELRFGCYEIPWMAPENLKNEPLCKSSNIYTWGTIMCEILTLDYPYQEYMKEFGPTIGEIYIYEKLYHGSLHPILPTACPESLQYLIASCFHSQPSLRPSAHEIGLQLKEIQNQKIFLC